MLEGRKRYPRLREEVRLEHPAGTDLFFLYRVDSGACYELNETSFSMIQLMDGAHSTVEIVRDCAASYLDGKEEAIHADLIVLIDQISAEGLLEMLEEKEPEKGEKGGSHAQGEV